MLAQPAALSPKAWVGSLDHEFSAHRHLLPLIHPWDAPNDVDSCAKICLIRKCCKDPLQRLRLGLGEDG